MRPLVESTTRWKETILQASSLPELKSRLFRADDDSPCTTGLRSVFWKIFLLFENADQSTWSGTLSDSRSAYSSLRSHFLKYIEHPEELSSSIDPLNDDQASPWNTIRRDEEIRTEILQDVERCMPEEPYFRQPDAQKKLLDILFIFCKLNQDIGYRQGMHELLAPFLLVLERDAIDKKSGTRGEPLMLDILEARFIEHDAFTLFSILMRSAKSSYELEEPDKKSMDNSPLGSGAISPQSSSPIVERSREIHEVYLRQLDPELAQHLTDIEILPQIFLIRWIRLLFGREFKLSELLMVWDVLFAEDPSLELVDMICVAMLLRIRWQLIDADYSVALTLLLRYPAPTRPHTFVEDALYLRQNFNPTGAIELIVKYGGKPLSPISSRPSTPHTLGSFSQARRRFSKRRSPLPSPARFIQQQGGVEALLQGAARGVYDRGEKMGINQRVRDAVEDLKKNMQTLQGPQSSSHSRRTSDITRWSLDDGRAVPSSKGLQAMAKRNHQLSQMLEEAMRPLRPISVETEMSKETIIESIDIAVAKINFVKVYLEDSSMALPEEESQQVSNTDQQQTHIPESVREEALTSPQPLRIPHPLQGENIADEVTSGSASAQEANDKARESPSHEHESKAKPIKRPVSVPTRSNLAQSSFAFMLEPDQVSSSPTKDISPFTPPVKQRPGREKAAFLFGDVSDLPESKTGGQRRGMSPDEGFNLGTMKGASVVKELNGGKEVQ